MRTQLYFGHGPSAQGGCLRHTQCVHGAHRHNINHACCGTPPVCFERTLPVSHSPLAPQRHPCMMPQPTVSPTFPERTLVATMTSETTKKKSITSRRTCTLHHRDPSATMPCFGDYFPLPRFSPARAHSSIRRPPGTRVPFRCPLAPQKSSVG